jgi:hypothetical protein
MSRRRGFRFVTVLLLAWIAWDLAAIDTCAFSEGQPAAVPWQSIQAPATEGPNAHPLSLPHPDSCLCRGHSTGAQPVAVLAAPACQELTVPPAASSYVFQISIAVFHPPQRAA